jgi:hypothetical protein
MVRSHADPPKNMDEKDKSQMPPPPRKEGESILEYSIRISGDKRTPEQIKEDSLKVEKIPLPKNLPPPKIDSPPRP